MQEKAPAARGLFRFGVARHRAEIADDRPRHLAAGPEDALDAMNTANLLWGLLFSSIGLGFFLYGKKQQRPVPLICGVALMIYPYFVPNTVALVVVGVVLTAIPYFYRP
jgi:hypothetical protein